MKLFFLSPAPVNPAITITGIDFQSYLSSLIANVLVALLAFFVFVLAIYIAYMAIQYFILFRKNLKVQKPKQDEIYGKQTIENLVG